jgi:hypothetical protein
MAINLALIATVFLTRDRWVAWAPEAELGTRGISEIEAVGPTGATVILWGDFPAEIWCVSRASRIAVLREYNMATLTLFSAAGNRALAYADHWPFRSVGFACPDIVDAPSSPVLIDLGTGELIGNFSRDGSPLAASISPDGTMAFMSFEDGTAGVWDACNGRLVVDLHGFEGGVDNACFSPDGGRLLVSDRNQNVFAFAPDTGERLVQYKSDWLLDYERVNGAKTGRLWGKEGCVEQLAYSVSGKVVWVVRSLTHVEPDVCEVFDAVTAKQTTQLTGRNFVFPSGGRRVAAHGPQWRTALVWDTETAGVVYETQCADNELRTPPGGRLLGPLAMDTRNVVSLIDTLSARELRAFEWPEALAPWFVSSAGERALVGRGPVEADAGIVSISTGRTVFAGNGFYGGRMLTEDSALLQREPDFANIIYRRIRPERWWGVFWLPHLYLIAALAAALAISGWRDLRRLRRA